MKIHVALGKLLQDVSDRTIQSSNWYYEIKIDGIRALVFSDGSVYTRYGNPLYLNIEPTVYRQIPKGMVLDCEACATDVWTTMALKSETKAKTVQRIVRIYAFDLVPETTIRNGTTYNTPYLERKDDLKRVITKLTSKDRRFIYVSHIKAKENNRKYFMKIAKMFYDKGFEGAMFKKEGHMYVPSRTSNWIKAKVFSDIDVKVIDVVVVSNKAKAFVCEYKRNRFMAGSGLTEHQRIFIAHHKDWFIDKTLNIKSMQYTDRGVPRVPIVVGFYYNEFTKEQAEELIELKLIKVV